MAARTTTARKSVKKAATSAKTTARAAKKTTKATAKSAARKTSKATKATARKTTKATKATARKVAAKAAPAKKAPARKAVAKKAPARAATGRNGAQRDAIAVLTADHRTVDQLFTKLERTGDGAKKERADLAEQIVRELSIHAAIEELVFYPTVRQLNKDIESMVLESLEEHHVVKWICDELHGMKPDAERFTAKATVLKETVQHHVEEEESDLFPKVRKAMDVDALTELGERLEQAKVSAPTRPHPKAPDTPPGNLANPAVGVVDRVRDRIRGALPG
ncbi:MAG TPA: hemerythrin domain-containing protein [Mycobacteriales bacterium]|nr:hemerythrin domain-containing protein [Mycobacteriales bacterium]